jgi:hypothetical protein
MKVPFTTIVYGTSGFTGVRAPSVQRFKGSWQAAQQKYSVIKWNEHERNLNGIA